jgi:hypothetical protein
LDTPAYYETVAEDSDFRTTITGQRKVMDTYYIPGIVTEITHTTVTNQNYCHEEIKSKLKSGNA